MKPTHTLNGTEIIVSFYQYIFYHISSPSKNGFFFFDGCVVRTSINLSKEIPLGLLVFFVFENISEFSEFFFFVHFDF